MPRKNYEPTGSISNEEDNNSNSETLENPEKPKEEIAEKISALEEESALLEERLTRIETLKKLLEEGNVAEFVKSELRRKMMEIDYRDEVDGKAIEMYRERINTIADRVDDFYKLGARIEYALGRVRGDLVEIEVFSKKGTKFLLFRNILDVYDGRSHDVGLDREAGLERINKRIEEVLDNIKREIEE